MKTKMLAIAALVLLSTSASAVGFSYFDRPDDADAFNQTTVSNDIYVRGFGFAWGDIRFKAEPGAGRNSQLGARDHPSPIGTSAKHAFGGGSALFKARGGAGVNVAAGDDDVQGDGPASFSTTH
ncbi:hypothetical protein P3W85_42255 [Cupriavidus basilensis]|uniref:Porin n=1 Tax=Cupriavidus basilensis TaxID=68895 RepID=A0ABT6B3R7_9BURK|nr:hypothetical protein [Cupriavidus basilensis]MDF3839515.1 hypothetical protein [Cupriavidus basilensis]